ncbi:serine-rich adhesin for platelets-like [Penaeus japonicus]|uniref:serine-rich adhesin for platelets-like n=1 Tax=Penaeus japonicus TaxID=27405 RepID=UPI001C7129E0|nr:serine-rich adhesin for platelets-like [Penaeus japonicus]
MAVRDKSRPGKFFILSILELLLLAPLGTSFLLMGTYRAVALPESSVTFQRLDVSSEGQDCIRNASINCFFTNTFLDESALESDISAFTHYKLDIEGVVNISGAAEVSTTAMQEVETTMTVDDSGTTSADTTTIDTTTVETTTADTAMVETTTSDITSFETTTADTTTVETTTADTAMVETTTSDITSFETTTADTTTVETTATDTTILDTNTDIGITEETTFEDTTTDADTPDAEDTTFLETTTDVDTTTETTTTVAPEMFLSEVTTKEGSVSSQQLVCQNEGGSVPKITSQARAEEVLQLLTTNMSLAASGTSFLLMGTHRHVALQRSSVAYQRIGVSSEGKCTEYCARDAACSAYTVQKEGDKFNCYFTTAKLERYYVRV